MQRSNKEIDKQYHSPRWKKLKKIKKMTSPFCEECLKKGILTPTYIVHHKIWINESNYNNDDIFFNIDNLESVCLECHNSIHFTNEKEYYFDNNGDLIKKWTN